jgi:hypothetical protein
MYLTLFWHLDIFSEVHEMPWKSQK